MEFWKIKNGGGIQKVKDIESWNNKATENYLKWKNLVMIDFKKKMRS